jgi:hypothetical protein
MVSWAADVKKKTHDSSSRLELQTMKSAAKKECTVCQKANSSYKCPKCLSPYCCSGCWATHKQSCPAIQVTAKEAEGSEVEVPAATRTPAASTSTASNDQKAAILLPEQKEGLSKSKELRALLKSKRLRDDITCIDSSADRQAALKAMRTKNPEFGEFVDLLLKSVNGTKPSQ